MTKTESTFSYIDTGFSLNSFSMLEELKETGELCDVTIKAGDMSFKAHRVILATRIPYFRAMFKQHFEESLKPEITMHDVNPGALQRLITFAYKGKLNISSNDVDILLTTAIFLQFNSAIDACFEFMTEQMNFNNVEVIREYAESDNCVSMIQWIDQYVAENFEEFSKLEIFLSLAFPTLKALISRDDLYVFSENTVFEAVVKWVKWKENERLLYLRELLHHVRMPLVKPECLKHDYVRELVDLSSCSDVLNGAFSCNFPAQERCCTRKHHLKCSRSMGCAMYCVCDVSGSYYVNYYDPVQAKWLALFDFEHSNKYNESDESDEDRIGPFIFCSDEKLFFVQHKSIIVLCLNSLEFTNLESSFDFSSDAIGCALHNGKLYLFGGIGDDSDMIQCLCLQRGTCFKVGRMTTKREGPGVVSLGEDIYVIGGTLPRGIDGETDASLWTNFISAERFSPASGRSTEISPMLQKGSCYEPKCAALNDKIYVLGGCFNDHGSYSPFAEVYDPATDQWKQIARTIGLSSAVSLVGYCGKLYAVHGFAEDTHFSVEIYDPDTDECKPGPPVLVPAEDEFAFAVATGATDAGVRL